MATLEGRSVVGLAEAAETRRETGFETNGETGWETNGETGPETRWRGSEEDPMLDHSDGAKTMRVTLIKNRFS
jgi:hypothetical protein